MAKRKRPSKGRSQRSRSVYDRIILIGILVAVIAICLSLWGPLKKFRPEEVRHKHAEKTKAGSAKKTVNGKTGQREDAGTKPDRSALVAIVIDDLGQDLKAAREIMSLPARITVSVMPGLPLSRTVAEIAGKNRKELLLHLPMEHRSPNRKEAPGMLRSDMTPMDFLTVLGSDVESVPGAVGVNNHEGSLLTENEEAMKFLMAELRTRDLIFLDSRTSPKSVAYATAREFGLKTAKRDVFLDNDSSSTEAIRAQLEELARTALSRGSAVGIGHPYPATISVLREWIPDAGRRGLTVVPLSRLAN